MLLFIVIAVIFLLLVVFDSKSTDTKNTLTFELPHKIIINDRPEMSLVEREHRRRKLLNECFKIGFYAREQLREKQSEDYKLSLTSYSYPKKYVSSRKQIR